MDAQIDEYRFELCLGQIVVRQRIPQDRMLLAADREHLDGMAVAHQSLCDAVHGQRASVDRRMGRLDAELQYLHGSGCCGERLFLRKCFETVAHDFGALDNVDESVGIEMTQVGFQFHQIGTVKGDVNHLAFMTLVETLSGEAGATALQVVEDEILQ